jgi:PAP2 superfamily
VSRMLIQSKAATMINPDRKVGLGDLIENKLSGQLDDPKAIDKWDPFIRYNICLFEAMSGLKMQPNGTDSASLLIGDATLVRIHAIKNIKIIEKQLLSVESWGETQRKDRTDEIVVQMAPQKPFWNTILNLQPHRHARTNELIELTVALAAICSIRFKHALNVPRPAMFSGRLQPIVPTPEHGSLPSGHATEAFAVVELMKRLLEKSARNDTRIEQLERLATRIAENRVVAGVHYPMDSAAGWTLGHAVAAYMQRLSCKTVIKGVYFNAAEFQPVAADSAAADFFLNDVPNLISDGTDASLELEATVSSAVLEKLWGEAKKEWQ